MTWFNQPGRNATPVANDRIDNASYLTYDFTVTDFVQDWLAGTTANHGFRLEVTQAAAATSGKVNCRSSDYSTASLRPKLTVSWYPQEAPFVRSYYSLGGQTIALRKVGGDSPGLYYVYADHLGSTQRLSTSTGSPVLESDARFLPFGKYRIVPTAGLTDRGFTGHLHNDPIGLVYMNARYYVPSIGRFAGADTIVPNPQNPQSYNRYSYGSNNPIKYLDPTGHYAEEGAGELPPPEPIRIPIGEWPIIGPLGLQGIEIIIMPPGTMPPPRNESVAQVLSAAGAANDVAEGLTAAAAAGGLVPAGLPDWMALGDLLWAGGSSYFAGETGPVSLHPDLPDMFLVGQDFIVTAADLGGALAAKVTLTAVGAYLGGTEGAATGLAGGQLVDVIASAASGAYDTGRTFGVLPTRFAIGFYMDTNVPTRIPLPGIPPGQPTMAIILYSP